MSELHTHVSSFIGPETSIEGRTSTQPDGGAILKIGDSFSELTLFIGHHSDVEGLRVLLELENAILVARDLLTKRVNESYNVAERGRYSMSSVQVVSDSEYEAAVESAS